MAESVQVPCISCGENFRVDRPALEAFPHGKGLGLQMGGQLECRTGLVVVDIRVCHRDGDMCPKCGLLFLRAMLERFEAKGEKFTGGVIGKTGKII